MSRFSRFSSSAEGWVSGGSFSEATLRISMLVAALSLMFSVFAMWHAGSTANELRTIESRLACLELPGSNPCGPFR
jgi:hypothetical protein